MHIDHLTELFDRQLTTLVAEVRGYTNEKNIWEKLDGTSNSAGNLVLHLCGNLRHFIGALLAHSGYVRDRDAEFGSGPIAAAELATLIETTRTELAAALQGLHADILDQQFPQPIGNLQRTTGFTLILLYGHFTYHLGQVNYHRRWFNALKS